MSGRDSGEKQGKFTVSNMLTDISLSVQKQGLESNKRAGEISFKGLLGKDSVSSGFKISKLDISAISPWFSLTEIIREHWMLRKFRRNLEGFSGKSRSQAGSAGV